MVAPDATKTVGTRPKAYLTVLFFDERFNFVQESSTTMRVGGVPGPNASLTAANLKAPKNGYAYVYVSNESQEPVYFDNLQVAHTRGRIAEETHYYSYGLQIAAISSKKVGDPREGTLDNRYGYNYKELWDDADLNWLDYGFRNYDPQIGRFVQLDPLADDYAFLSPYLYAYDDPIANVDVDGLFGEGILSTTAATAKTLSTVVVYAVRKVTPIATKGGTFGKVLKASASIVITTTEQLVKQAARIIEGNQMINGALQKSSSFFGRFGPYMGHALGTAFAVLSPLQAGPKPVAIPGYKIVGDRAIAVDANGNPKYGPAPNPNTNPTGGEEDNEQEDQYVYRSGPFTDVNFTPKEADTQPGPKQGWSTFTDPLSATFGRGGKVQALSIKKLNKLGFGLNFDGNHVGIVPKSQKALNAWAATKEPLKAGKRGAHLLTKILKKARVKEIKL